MTDAATCDEAELACVLTPAPMIRPSAFRRHFQLIKTVPPHADIVMVGDSLTASWPNDLLKKTFPGQSVFNFGVGGDRVQQVLWRLQESKFSCLRPQQVYLLLGTNNFGYDKAAAILIGLDAVIRRIDALWNAPFLNAIEVLPRGAEFCQYEADRLELNSGLRQLIAARGNGRVFNFDDEITEGRNQDTRNYHPDRVHLSPAGYLALHEAISRRNKPLEDAVA